MEEDLGGVVSLNVPLLAGVKEVVLAQHHLKCDFRNRDGAGAVWQETLLAVLDTVARSEDEPEHRQHVLSWSECGLVSPVLYEGPGTHLVEAVVLAVYLYEGGPRELPVAGVSPPQYPALGHWAGEATARPVLSVLSVLSRHNKVVKLTSHSAKSRPAIL